MKAAITSLIHAHDISALREDTPNRIPSLEPDAQTPAIHDCRVFSLALRGRSRRGNPLRHSLQSSRPTRVMHVVPVVARPVGIPNMGILPMHKARASGA